MSSSRIWSGILLALVLPLQSEAQGYRLRLDSRVQGVSWRGIERDSIPRPEAVPQPGGGFLTPGGLTTTCEVEWCHYLRAGSIVQGVPWVNQADLTVWGFGIPGMRLRVNARYANDLGDAAHWPGTDPQLQLVEGYLEYARAQLAVQGGRQFLSSRLGSYGLDGIRGSWRPTSFGLDVVGYAGWGLARGTVLPVTSPAVNPLDDFQPRDRQLALGLEAGLSREGGEVRLEYRREVDPAVDYFVSERAAASLTFRPIQRVSLAAGAAYDLSMAHWGSADANISWVAPVATFTVGARRYLPFFDLWTIWGAFSPVAFHAWHGSITATPGRGLTVYARGERYQYEDSGTFTGLVNVEDRGWRVEGGATWEASPHWMLTAGHQAEFGPGASSLGYDARITWHPHDDLGISAHGATLRRPLELRFSDATLAVFGAEVDWRPSTTWRLALGVTRIDEQRDRPDAAAIDWDQWRLSARVTLLRGTDVDRLALPRAVRAGTPP